ncbi:MAG: biotin--[acetyl-CoA-carboxylase] ligase [Rhodobacteraceae bacterium]|nr:biotin--[acetyl-CoA-carboxylase] ligase [Paracoccaceae bacterium]
MTSVRFTYSHDPTKVKLPAGWRFKRVDSIDSTNSALKRMVETGADAEQGLVLMADVQTAGRGRAGRAWLGGEGNLFASMVLLAPDPPHRAAEIGFIAALAVIEAIQRLAPDAASDALLKCKWPNDVLCDGGKVAGLLLESVSGPDGTDLVILGIGVNLRPVDVTDTGYAVTSLADHGMALFPARVIEAIVHTIAPRLEVWRRDGFAPVREEWLKRCAGLGEQISVRLPGGTKVGKFVELDSDGALILKTAYGSRERIMAGDVMLGQG